MSGGRHFGIDARTLFAGGKGDRTYWRDLLPLMAERAPDDEFLLYYRDVDEEREALARESANMRTVGVNSKVGALWAHGPLPAQLRRDRASLLHAQYTLPLLAPCPTVVTIHDIIFQLHPEWFDPRHVKLMKTLIPRAAKSATRIITGSEYSKADLVKAYGVRPEKIVVTPYGVSNHFRPLDHETAREQVFEYRPEFAGQFFLGVGVRGPRKNVQVVLRAVQKLRDTGRWPDDARIGLSGIAAEYNAPETRAALDALGGIVVFLGFIQDWVLPAFYSAAVGVFYPSLYEGFGFPVLEAMACGTPVLCSNATSLPEVAGDAARLLEPHSVDAWAEAMAELLNNDPLRATMSRNGIEHAAGFTWEKTAEATLRVYEKVLA